MTWMTILRPLSAALLLLPGTVVHAAGGSFVVDDATVTEQGRCQIEAWLRAGSGSRGDLNLAPACEAAGIEWSLEMVLGLGREDPDALGLAAKRVWSLNDRLALGLIVAATHSRTEADQVQLSVPLSYAATVSESFIVHINVGTRHERGDGSRATGGIGGDLALAGSALAIVELFWAVGAETVQQAGIRYPLTDSMELDLVHGRQRPDRERWLTLGINLAF